MLEKRHWRGTGVGVAVVGMIAVMLVVVYETVQVILGRVKSVTVGKADLRKEEEKQRHSRRHSLPVHPQRNLPENRNM
jgi:hypothetical protein